MNRYRYLTDLINVHKPSFIVEFGTNAGDRAVQMIEAALAHRPDVQYLGIDLFDDLTDDISKQEFNAKPKASVAAVSARLDDIKRRNPQFTYRLHKGNSREFTTRLAADFVFIDGGHSVETIRHDHGLVEGSKVIVFDDYYRRDVEGLRPDTNDVGCNQIVAGLDHVVFPDGDQVVGGGWVHMAVVPAAAAPKTRLEIKTKNCVPDEEIRRNIEYAMLKALPYVTQCRVHENIAVMCSGGPSLDNYIDTMKVMMENPRNRIVCVKHSHDKLIDAGVVPWACMLLDPRDHVQDFIENPHPDILYLVGSMVHPTTIDRLVERNAKVRLYHAHVGAGEENTIRSALMFQDNERHRILERLRKVLSAADFNRMAKMLDHRPDERSSVLLPGGSTSAMRGMSVLSHMGFRHFRLFGYDSCFPEKPDLTERTKTGEPKYYKVSVAGREFWTSGELIAQYQDFRQVMEKMPDLDIEVFGDGMIQHAFPRMKKLPTLEEAVG